MKPVTSAMLIIAALILHGCGAVGVLEEENVELRDKVDSLSSLQGNLKQRVNYLENQNMELDNTNRQLQSRLTNQGGIAPPNYLVTGEKPKVAAPGTVAPINSTPKYTITSQQQTAQPQKLQQQGQQTTAVQPQAQPARQPQPAVSQPAMTQQQRPVETMQSQPAVITKEPVAVAETQPTRSAETDLVYKSDEEMQRPESAMQQSQDSKPQTQQFSAPQAQPWKAERYAIESGATGAKPEKWSYGAQPSNANTSRYNYGSKPSGTPTNKYGQEFNDRKNTERTEYAQPTGRQSGWGNYTENQQRTGTPAPTYSQTAPRQPQQMQTPVTTQPKTDQPPVVRRQPIQTQSVQSQETPRQQRTVQATTQQAVRQPQAAPSRQTAPSGQVLPAFVNASFADMNRDANYSFLAEYQKGLAAFKKADYSGCISVLTALLQRSEVNSMSDNCDFWIAESYYAMRDFTTAKHYYGRVLSYPESDKSKDAKQRIAVLN